MYFDVVLALAVVSAMMFGIYGLIKRFPSFVIQGTLVNVPGFIAALRELQVGCANGLMTGGGWWLLTVICVFFAIVCIQLLRFSQWK
jgi:hypothetical protein